MAARTDYRFPNGDNIWFTSDTHFSHENIIKFCRRPFSNVEEMDNTIIENWNKTIPQDGLVFHLGDFAWGGAPIWRNIREKLNGKIILITGNHDWKNGPQSMDAMLKLFERVAQQMYIRIGDRCMILNHCPLLCYGGTYRKPDQLVYNLHGHVHLTPSKNTGKDFERMAKFSWPTQYDVGVDFNNFTPISWNEVNAKIEQQVLHETNSSLWIDDSENNS